MPLPLNDTNNPLYRLPIEAQCQVLIQWQEQSLTPYQLLSLPQQYTKNQINKAYRQLATRFHPDKNPGNKSAEDAFKVVTAACEYLDYGLKSGMERHDALNTVRNNPFYQVYGEQGLGQTDFAPFYFGGFQYAGSAFSASTNNSTRQEKAFDKMSFSEFFCQLPAFPYDESLPVKFIDALKRHINADKGHLTTRGFKHATVVHMVAKRSEFDFLRWLIEEAGAHPGVMADKDLRDVTFLVAKSGNVDFLRYLFQRFGAQLFYDESEQGLLSAQWWRFENAFRYGKMAVAQFLLAEVGYIKCLNNRKLDRHWFEDCISNISTFLVRGPRYFGRLDFKPSATSEKLIGLAILRDLLDRDGVCPDVLYCAIQELSLSLGSTHSYVVDQGILDLLCRLLDHLDARFNKNLKQNKQRNFHLLSVSHAAEKYAHYETLEKLQAISEMPPIESISGTLLGRAFFRWPKQNGEWEYPDTDNQQEDEKRYKRTLSFLTQVGSPLILLDDDYTFNKDKGTTYRKYTLLHLACEAGWEDWALQLIKKMSEEGYSLDTLATRELKAQSSSHSIYNPLPSSYYQHNSLHLAIEKGQSQIAVSLIKAGANIHLKAVIEQPDSSYCNFFQATKRIEKTPLAMAIEYHQPQVIQALQWVMLKEYIKQRQEEPEYLSQLRLFGYVLLSLGSFNLCGLIWGFGYEKETKLQKAYEFRDLLTSNQWDEASFNRFNEGAAQDGRLGQIVGLSRYYLNSHTHLQSLV